MQFPLPRQMVICELCRGQVVEIHVGFIAPIKCATGFLYHHLCSSITLQLLVVDNAGEAWH